MVLDSGTSGHYITPKQATRHAQKDHNTIKVTVANGDVIKSTATDILPLDMPIEAKRAHVLPKLDKSLLSISQFDNNGLKTLFADGDAYVFQSKLNGSEIIQKVHSDVRLQGRRQPTNGLYTTQVETNAVPRVGDV